MTLVYHGTYLEDAIKAVKKGELKSYWTQLFEKELASIREEFKGTPEDYEQLHGMSMETDARNLTNKLTESKKDAKDVSVSTFLWGASDNGVVFGIDVDEILLNQIFHREKIGYLKKLPNPDAEIQRYLSKTGSIENVGVIYIPDRLSLEGLKKVYLDGKTIAKHHDLSETIELVEELKKYNPVYHLRENDAYGWDPSSPEAKIELSPDNIIKAIAELKTKK